jgi:rod shape-determining protein MreD
MKPVLYILGLISLILFQTTLLEEVTIAGIKPDLALIVVYFFGIFGGEVRGVMTGLALGYFMDLMSGGVWGIHLVTKLTLGFLAGFLGRTLMNVSVIFTGVIIALCSVIQGLVFLLVSYITSEPEDLLVFLSQIMLPQAIYDGVVGYCLFWFLSRRFLPKQSTAQEWLRNPALSALGRGSISSTRVEKKV